MSTRTRSLTAVIVVAVLAAVAAVAAPVDPKPASAAGTWSAPAFVYSAAYVQAEGYAYAPAAIAGSPQRIYTCHQRTSGSDIRDDIFLTKRTGTSVTSSTSVLAGSSGFDAHHNCDPTVVRVNAVLGGHTYSYAMFYLGNDVDYTAHNQIGVAYADSLDGPWVKTGSPVISFNTAYPTSYWGIGQATATTIDAAAGTVMLGWTEGYGPNVGKMAQVTLGAGGPTVTGTHTIPMAGLANSNGPIDELNNFDLVYSPQRDRFFMVRELRPYPTSQPNYISSAVQLTSIAGPDLWAGTGSWTLEGTIGASLTGKARTHNPGFLRSEYGTLPDESRITVMYSTSDLDPGSLWGYQIWETTASL